MKLQQGDYVTDLTEEQFNELIGISNLLKLPYIKPYSICFKDGSVFYAFNRWSLEITQLTFDEFRERAIDTFGQ